MLFTVYKVNAGTNLKAEIFNVTTQKNQIQNASFHQDSAEYVLIMLKLLEMQTLHNKMKFYYHQLYNQYHVKAAKNETCDIDLERFHV